MDWITAVKDVGFPIVASLAIGGAVWATLKWIAANVIIPARDGLLAFLVTINHNVDRMTENLDAQTESLRDINATNREIKESIAKLTEYGCATVHRNGVRGGNDHNS